MSGLASYSCAIDLKAILVILEGRMVLLWSHVSGSMDMAASISFHHPLVRFMVSDARNTLPLHSRGMDGRR